MIIRRFLLVLSALGGVASAVGADTTIGLNSQCPPYFLLDQDRRCRLSTLYDLYPAVNREWGGYRVALGERRDGFTPQQIDLGRYLFFDPVLSVDRSLSCAHCHTPAFAMADGRARSMGRAGNGLGPQRTAGQLLPRAAPALWNLAFQKTFFWDARAESLEAQVEAVLHNPAEMATSPRDLVDRLNAIPAYRQLFREVFATQSIQYQQVLAALVAFEGSLISLNSPYDRYIHGAADALSSQQINGLNIFRSFATRCSQCHTPPLFTSGQLATTGVPSPIGVPFDAGAGAVSGEPSLHGAFRVPSLRNVARTAPYMHAGQFASLTESIDFYNAEPGHAVPEERARLTLHWHMVDVSLRPDEIEDLVAFLHALSDETAAPTVPGRLPSGLPVLR